MILCEKIVRLRKKNGWSQEELAEMLHVSRQSVSKWESGNSIPDLNRILLLAQCFGVSTDYLLRDELEDPDSEEAIGESFQEAAHKVSLEDARHYLKDVQQGMKQIRLGVMLFILSPILVILLAGMAELGKIPISEDLGGGIGTCVLLLLVAGGVALCIFSGMKLSAYEYLEKEPIELEYGVTGILREEKKKQEALIRTCIILGVIFCIISPMPLLLADGLGVSEVTELFFVVFVLVMVSIAVFLFITGGMIKGAYDKLLQEGDYSRVAKKKNKKTEKIMSIYWPCVTAIYLLISFLTGAWWITWIVWPIAGVASGIISAICGWEEDTQ